MIKHEKGEFELMNSIGYPKHIAWIIYNDKCRKLRSMVAVSIFTNKTCEFFSQPKPKPQPKPQHLNLKSATETVRSETETETETMLKIDEIVMHECVVKYGII